MTHTTRSLTVLVVDDEALLRWSIAELLRRGGHTVIEATSAATARDAMSDGSDSIDVVLLDYRLPDSHDLRLLDEVRRRLPQSAVVLMTAHGTPEVMQGALNRGVLCVLSKPFDMHDREPRHRRRPRSPLPLTQGPSDSDAARMRRPPSRPPMRQMAAMVAMTPAAWDSRAGEP